MDTAVLWRMRVTWALVGAGVTLAIVTVRERSEGDVEVRPVASREAGVEPVPVAASEPVPDPESVVATPVASVDAPITAVIDDVLEPPPPPDVPAPAEPPAEATPPDPVEPYEIPLPLMPGTRIMKRTHKLHAQGGTVHTLALHVPAPGRQVEAFYRSALADADLAVLGGSTKPTTMGSGHRSSLHGRGREATVHVNLQQSAGTLRTIVRIIWRRHP